MLQFTSRQLQISDERNYGWSAF